MNLKTPQVSYYLLFLTTILNIRILHTHHHFHHCYRMKTHALLLLFPLITHRSTHIQPHYTLLVWQLLMRSYNQHQPQQWHRWFPMVSNCRTSVASPVLLLQIFSAKNIKTRKWRDCVLAWLGWIEGSFLIYVFVGMLFRGN